MGSFRVAKPVAGEKVRRGIFKRDDFVTKRGGNVMTYFCTPDMQVVNLLIGPVRPDTVLAEARWAAETYQNALAQSKDPKEIADIIRRAHRAKLSEAVLSTFENNCRSRGVAVSGEMAGPSQRAVFEAANRSGRVALTQLRNFKDAAQRLSKVLLQDRHNMVLSRLAMKELGDIEKDAFELLARQPYGRRSKRQDQALELVNSAKAQNRPVMIFITSHAPMRMSRQPLVVPQRMVESRDGQGINDVDLKRLIPKSRAIRKRLGRFKLLKMSYDEASTLADDLNQTALPQQRNGYAHVVLLDGSGKRAATVIRGGAGYSLASSKKSDQAFDRDLSRPLANAMARALAEKTPKDIPQPGYRRFVSDNGQFAVMARVRGVNGSNVLLLTQPGNKIEVPIERFSKSDGAYIKRFVDSQRRNQARLKQALAEREEE